MPRIHGVLETCIYARDLDAAERFYRDVLGLEPFARAAGRHVFFRCGVGVLLVFNPDVTGRSGGELPPHGAAGATHAAFAVAQGEMSGWRERLARYGVTVEADIAWPRGGRSLYVRDPAGNSIELAAPEIWGLALPDDPASG